MNNWIKDFVHNALVHPLLPFLPTATGNALHDWNAKWAYGDPHARTSAEAPSRFPPPGGMDLTAHDLMNLATSSSEGAELFRFVCDAWAGEGAERAGPTGPRIGTVYVENNDGLLEIRLVTRLSHPDRREAAA